MAKRRRFSRLKAAERLNNNGAVAKYKQFDADSSSVGYTVTPVDRGKNVLMGCKPFGTSDTTAVYRTKLSGTAFADIGSFTLDATTDLGLTPAADITTSNANYVPAKAICSVLNATAAAKTSKITGLGYKTNRDKSRTYPFGKVGTTDVEWERQIAIRAKVGAVAAPGASISFQGEHLYAY